MEAAPTFNWFILKSRMLRGRPRLAKTHQRIGRALLRPPRRLLTIDHSATSLGPRCAIANRHRGKFPRKKLRLAHKSASRVRFADKPDIEPTSSNARSWTQLGH